MMAELPRAVVDREQCIGSGMCEAIAPDDFELDDEARSKVLPPVSDLEAVREAVDSCPSMAIRLDE